MRNNALGVSQSGRWTVQIIPVIALSIAVSIVVSYISIPLLPEALWLKYDVSAIVAILMGFSYGTFFGVFIGVASYLPHLFTQPLGGIAAISITAAMIVITSATYHILVNRMRRELALIVSLILGSIAEIAASVVVNLLLTPIYAKVSIAQVAAMLVPIIIPFNLIKCVLHTIITCCIAPTVMRVLSTSSPSASALGANAHVTDQSSINDLENSAYDKMSTHSTDADSTAVDLTSTHSSF